MLWPFLNKDVIILSLCLLAGAHQYYRSSLFLHMVNSYINILFQRQWPTRFLSHFIRLVRHVLYKLPPRLSRELEFINGNVSIMPECLQTVFNKIIPKKILQILSIFIFFFQIST